MTDMFTDEELEILSAEVDQQLQELQELRRREITRHVKSQSQEGFSDKEVPREDELLIKQKELIEQLTQESMPSFMAKLGRAARSEICDEDGFLYKQWEKWGDLENKDALKVMGGVLAGMGITGNVWPTVTVAVVVVILRIGRRAFCEDYGDKNK